MEPIMILLLITCVQALAQLSYAFAHWLHAKARAIESIHVPSPTSATAVQETS